LRRRPEALEVAGCRRHSRLHGSHSAQSASVRSLWQLRIVLRSPDWTSRLWILPPEVKRRAVLPSLARRQQAVGDFPPMPACFGSGSRRGVCQRMPRLRLRRGYYTAGSSCMRRPEAIVIRGAARAESAPAFRSWSDMNCPLDGAESGSHSRQACRAATPHSFIEEAGCGRPPRGPFSRPWRRCGPKGGAPLSAAGEKRLPRFHQFRQMMAAGAVSYAPAFGDQGRRQSRKYLKSSCVGRRDGYNKASHRIRRVYFGASAFLADGYS